MKHETKYVILESRPVMNTCAISSTCMILHWSSLVWPFGPSARSPPPHRQLLSAGRWGGAGWRKNWLSKVFTTPNSLEGDGFGVVAVDCNVITLLYHNACICYTVLLVRTSKRIVYQFHPRWSRTRISLKVLLKTQHKLNWKSRRQQLLCT